MAVWQKNTTQVKKIKLLTNCKFFFYIFTATVISFGVLFFYGPNTLFVNGIWNTWGDLLYFQSIAQVSINAGPLGVTQHLGWPDGFSLWSYPQSGFILPTLFWMAGQILRLTSSGSIVFGLAVVSALNGCAIYFFLRSISKKRELSIVSVALAIALCLSPFTLQKMGHLNVAAFYLVPLTLGFILRLRSNSPIRFRLISYFAIAFVYFSAPLWWAIVGIDLLLSMILFSIISSLKINAIAISKIFFSAMIGTLIQIIIFLNSPGSDVITRSRWDSNIYGGRLVDLFLSSPILLQKFPNLLELAGGASVELSQVGLIGSGLAVLAICYPLRLISAKKPQGSDEVMVGLISLTSLFLFISGGFGNLQAGFLALFQADSPARVWSRLIIMIAVAGAAVVIVYLNKIQLDRKFLDYHRLGIHVKKINRKILFLILITSLIFSDLRAMAASKPIEVDQVEEYQAVRFISSSCSQKCAVLQLPVESMPKPIVTRPEEWPDTYYRGLIPYILAPKLNWSFGDYQRKNKNTYLTSLGSEISPESVSAIRLAGFSYVLFDKTLADISTRENLMLPGTYITNYFGKPIFISERFLVFKIQK